MKKFRQEIEKLNIDIQQTQQDNERLKKRAEERKARLSDLERKRNVLQGKVDTAKRNAENIESMVCAYPSVLVLREKMEGGWGNRVEHLEALYKPFLLHLFFLFSSFFHFFYVLSLFITFITLYSSISFSPYSSSRLFLLSSHSKHPFPFLRSKT